MRIVVSLHLSDVTADSVVREQISSYPIGFDFAGADGKRGVVIGVERRGIVAMRAIRAEAQGILFGEPAGVPFRNSIQPHSVFDKSRHSSFRTLLGRVGGAPTDAPKTWSLQFSSHQPESW